MTAFAIFSPENLKRHQALIYLFAFSAITHFVWLYFPREIVFDEVHFGGWASAYFSHKYVFDIHPPHGKLLFALMAYIGGMDPNFSFPKPGDPYPAQFYIVMRALPATLGTLLPLFMYGLVRELGIQRLFALGVAWLVALDTSLLAISRFILMDMLLLSSGIAAWWTYARYRRTKTWTPLIASAFFTAVTISIKWTGLGFAGMIAVVHCYDLWKHPTRRGWAGIGLFTIIPASWYYLGFAIHFALLTFTGPDLWANTPEYQKRFQGNAHYLRQDIEAKSTFEAFLELNKIMYTSSAHANFGDHPAGSRWYSWPLGSRYVGYWTDFKEPNRANIFMLPNVGVWWLASFGMLYLLVNLIPKLVAAIIRRQHAGISGLELLLAGAYLLNFLPFVAIKRVMFLYHYFPALLITIIGLAYLAQKVSNPRNVVLGVISIAAAIFFYQLPTTYGFPMTPERYASHMWLESWR